MRLNQKMKGKIGFFFKKITFYVFLCKYIFIDEHELNMPVNLNIKQK